MTGMSSLDQAGREHIVEAWKCDSNSLTLRAMPRITHSHLFPNSFEKMRVNLAFHLFNEEVERGLHLCHEQIQGQAKFLDSFLDCLDKWEDAAKDGGILSQSMAEGLRVTLHSTQSLLQYLTTLGYQYIMMARLSQNCIERLFGIIPQSSGPNDHPTPAQFLILANCLSFYNLAKSPTGGSVSKGVLSSLFCAEDAETTARDQLDALLEAGKLHEVEEALVEDDMPAASRRLATLVSSITWRDMQSGSVSTRKEDVEPASLPVSGRPRQQLQTTLPHTRAISTEVDFFLQQTRSSSSLAISKKCSRESCGQAPAWNPFAQLFAQPSALSTTEPAAESA
ncbi:hypothetical protein HPB47_016284 [Ixodes persulcatus]|uniref:Uncharacterized protein n=1 Tax=Ixodes persulcatus TaxID=34615 RepID=A0AC60QTP5_IXOPE|nr:hypothetical protein HPB47_016284 [Ixodes persulcatus]